ncbi:MAG: FHA domain-containing protein [Spirulinaceae cyanobacterium]
MSELTLSWQEANQTQAIVIQENQQSKNPGTFRIGRNPGRCDLVLTNPTVSGLHVEIFFDAQQKQFLLRNLRQSNPPFVDGKRIIQGEAKISQGSVIILGQMTFNVVQMVIDLPSNNFPKTVIVSPQPQQIPQAVHNRALNSGNYGLECPHCHRISSYERIDFGCQWCGTSLAGAASVLVPKS